MHVVYVYMCVFGGHACFWHREGATIQRKGVHQDIDSYSAFFDNGRRFQTELHDVLSSKGVTEVYCVGVPRSPAALLSLLPPCTFLTLHRAPL